MKVVEFSPDGSIRVNGNDVAHRILAGLLLAVTLVACGGSPAVLDPATSGPEGIPVPANAVAAGEGTWHVPGVTFAQLRSWYEAKLPDSAVWRGWTWCERINQATLSQWNYYHPGTSDLLAVAIIEDDSPGLLIATDDSGPC